MASRRHDVEETIDTAEAINEVFPVTDDDPEEFTADAPVTRSNGDSSGYVISSLDELNQFKIDQSLKEREYAEMNPPRGDWEKLDKWSIDLKKDIYVQYGNSQPTDINPEGRVKITVRGHCVPRTDDHNYSHDPEFTMTVSPDSRKVEKNGILTPDQPSQLYQEARAAYLTLYGKNMDEQPSTLVKFLLEGHYFIQAFKGDNGIVVNKIKARKSRGSR